MVLCFISFLFFISNLSNGTKRFATFSHYNECCIHLYMSRVYTTICAVSLTIDGWLLFFFFLLFIKPDIIKCLYCTLGMLNMFPSMILQFVVGISFSFSSYMRMVYTDDVCAIDNRILGMKLCNLMMRFGLIIMIMI